MPDSANPPAPQFATLAVHAGAAPDPSTGARVTPIYQTTSFVFNDADHAAALFGLEAFGNIYTRIMNPTQAVLESRIAALEGGTAALAVASGHAAQFLVFHTLLEPGDEFVAGRQLYGGSINQFNHSFKKSNWNVVWADATNPASFEKALTPKTRAIFVESIANPGGLVIDLPAIAAIAKKAGVPLIVDNTLATPYLCRPEGARRRHRRALADQVHRRARQLDRRRHRRLRHLRLAGGQAPLQDAGRAERVLQRHEARRDVRQLRLRHRRRVMGLRDIGAGDLALQRVPHPDRHRDAAAAHGAPLRERARRRELAREAPEGRLGELSPGLPSSPYHALAKKICPKGAGAVFTFGLKGGYEAGVKLVSSLKLFSHLANIGDARSLVIHPASTTHRQLTDEQREGGGRRPRRRAPLGRHRGQGRHHRRPRAGAGAGGVRAAYGSVTRLSLIRPRAAASKREAQPECGS